MTLIDLESTNGTILVRSGRRVDRTSLEVEDEVQFGSVRIPVARLLNAAPPAPDRGTGREFRLAGSSVLLGRDPSAAISVPHPTVSWQHARLERAGSRLAIVDLGSRNGTFVRGRRISGRVELAIGDEVVVGNCRLRLLDAEGTFARRTYTGDVTLSASGVTVRIPGRAEPLLSPTSLTVYPSELVALMGPAGAGKTTLLKLLNGYTAPASGVVLFNGLPLEQCGDLFRLQVGYVPQDDILHPQLTVREALRFTAQLRTDLRSAEIEARIETVLRELGIDDIGDRLIGSPERKVISGGQRKRVNIAMELLSAPSVLFLDEPTSGLSSYDAELVIGLLRAQADAGRTVICTIHQPSADVFMQFDLLAMVARDKGDVPGHLAYFGDAVPGAFEFFGATAPDGATPVPGALLTGLATRSAEAWAAAYSRSRAHADYVTARASGWVSPASAVGPARRAASGLRQLPILARRNLLLKLRDSLQTFVLLAQAPLFGVLVALVYQTLPDATFTDAGAWAAFQGNVTGVHFLMVVAAVWFGCNNAARDIVGEASVFERERMVNLSIPAYLAAKLAVHALLCAIQCAVLVGIVVALCKLVAPPFVLVAILFATALTGTALGLLISAAVSTSEAAIALLPLVLLPFLLLGGGLRPVGEMSTVPRWMAAATPTRWAFEAGLLQEASHRSATLELAGPTGFAAPASGEAAARTTPALTRPDVAERQFPRDGRRSSLSQSLQIIGAFFAVCTLLALSTLTRRAPR